MTDVSVDMTANGFDASESFTLDRSMAEDMVPVADPGLERPSVSSMMLVCVRADEILVPFTPGIGHSK
jgi:hypothetical protein